MDELLTILGEINLPFAYDHFADGEVVDPPFICYLFPQTDNFSADGSVYFSANEVHIELYTDKKDLTSEQAVEAALKNHNVFYNKYEMWIDSEKLFQVLYIFEWRA
jgi:hypothetical protein